MVFNFLALLLFSSLFFGCGLKMGEKKQENEVVEVKSVKCLDAAVASLKIYFAGDATDEQASTSFQCLQDVIVAFKDNIRGQNKDVFTPEEVAQFVEENFIKDKSTFSSSFLDQVMKFKVALIGGQTDVITKGELQQVVTLIAVLKSDLVKINKSMKILTLKWNPDLQPKDAEAKEKQFLQAKKDFARLVQKITMEFAKSGQKYQLDHIVDFAKEVVLFSDKNNTKGVEQIEKGRDLLKKFKAAVIGGSVAIEEQEWTRVGTIASEGLFQLLRYNYFIKDLNETQTIEKWSQFEKIAADVTLLLRNVLAAKDLHFISNSEIHDLIVAAEPFTDNLKISEKILNGVGDIKLMILGVNDSDRFIWSSGDFNVLSEKVPRLMAQIPILIQAYETLFPKEAGQTPISYDEFTHTEQLTNEAVWQLSQLIEYNYSMESAKEFIQILAADENFKDIVKLPKDFEKYYKIAVAGKTVLTGQADTNLTAANIKLLLNVVARAGLNYMEYDFYMSKYNTRDAAYYQSAHLLLHKIAATVETNLVLKTQSYYSTTDIIQFLDFMQKQEYIKLASLKLESIQTGIEGLCSHLLNNPEQRLAGQVLPGLNSESIKVLVTHLGSFLKAQQSVATIYETVPKLNKEELKQSLKYHIDNSADAELKAAVGELLSAVSSKVALTFDDKSYLPILADQNPSYRFDDVLWANLARTAGRAFITGYANDMARVTSLKGITVTEAQIAFNQFKPIALDLEAIDPKTADEFIASRFREASLFLTSSNGDEFASENELHDMVIHILSGMKRAKDLEPIIFNKCVPQEKWGLKSPFETEVDEDCLLQIYFDEVNAFTDLPQFLNLKTVYTPEQIKTYYMYLLKAAGHIPKPNKTVLFGDANLFPHVVQYIEMIYASYDTNGDQILTREEADVAFPVFKDTIRQVVEKIAPQVKEPQYKGVFMYLLKYGKAPKTIAEKLAFAGFISNPDKWILNTTRLDLGVIFNTIADSTKPAPAAAKPAVATPQ